MFDQLDLSPMMLLMLLLYGLLIAVILVLWTALDLGGRRKPAERAAEQPLQKPVQPVRRNPTVQQETRKPAAPPPDARASRRVADSDSVVSYSVRPRVTEREQRPAFAEKPAAPAEAAGAVPRPLKQPIPTAEVDFPTGRESRKPRADKPATVSPVKPPPPRGEQAGNPQRSKSEDAFERFLRSRGDDNDDF